MSTTNPSVLTITMQDGSTVLSVAIPTILRSLNSGQTIDTQTGVDSVDSLVASIFKRGYVYDSTRSTAYSASYIKTITWS